MGAVRALFLVSFLFLFATEIACIVILTSAVEFSYAPGNCMEPWAAGRLAVGSNQEPEASSFQLRVDTAHISPSSPTPFPCFIPLLPLFLPASSDARLFMVRGWSLSSYGLWAAQCGCGACSLPVVI